MSISFTAHDAKIMELHKTDIMFGVRERVYAEIMAAAYKGNTGVEVKIPCAYQGYIEMDIFMRELMDSGFEILDNDDKIDDDGNFVYGIYWGAL